MKTYRGSRITDWVRSLALSGQPVPSQIPVVPQGMVIAVILGDMVYMVENHEDYCELLRVDGVKDGRLHILGAEHLY